MLSVRYVSLAESSGYGLSAQGYLRALLATGARIQWVPLVATTEGYLPWERVDGAATWMEELSARHGTNGYYTPEILATMHETRDCDLVLVHTIPELWTEHLDPKRRSLGYTVWETDTLPPHWSDLINRADEVLVPCSWNLDVFERSGIELPLHLLPHALQPLHTTPSREQVDTFRRKHGIASDHSLFYSIDSWNPRKAPWRLIDTFQRAFNGGDGVVLIVKTSLHGPRSAADPLEHPTPQLVAELLSAYPDPAPVILLDQELPASEIDLLHEVGDCFLSMSHCEGWGLSAFEAAARGNPVIMTGWGGQLEYLGEDWPFLIDSELTPVMSAQGRASYLPTQQWASADRGHAIALMKEVHSDIDAARERCAPGRRRILRDFDEVTVGRRLVEILETSP